MMNKRLNRACSKIRRRGTSFFLKAAVFFTALAGVCSLHPQDRRSAAVPAEKTAETQNRSGLGDMGFIFFLDAAGGKHLVWGPDWPLSVPPDLFGVLPGTKAREITVRYEVPETNFSGTESGAQAASGTETAEQPPVIPDTLAFTEQNGRLVSFPVFTGSAFVQGKAEYGASGEIKRISAGDGFDAEILEQSDEGLLARILIDGEYSFAVLEYGVDRVTETRYDADGNPLFVAQAAAGGEIVTIRYGGETAEAEVRKLYFGAFGLVSGMTLPGGESLSVRYERRGLPSYLTKTSAGGTGHWRFQWDQPGRLVRLTGTYRPETAATDQTPGESADSRYEYVFDGRGNWVERREIIMLNRMGRLFPVPGGIIRRQIRYADNGGNR